MYNKNSTCDYVLPDLTSEQKCMISFVSGVYLSSAKKARFSRNQIIFAVQQSETSIVQTFSKLNIKSSSR